MAKTTKGDLATWIRGRASRHAEVDETTTGAGTANESSTYTALKKAFLFVASQGDNYELRLKLGASKAEASRMASKSPDRFAIGATGWAKITFPKSEPGPRPILERWIDESYALFVPASSKAGKGDAKASAAARARSAPIVKSKASKPAARAKR